MAPRISCKAEQCGSAVLMQFTRIYCTNLVFTRGKHSLNSKYMVNLVRIQLPSPHTWDASPLDHDHVSRFMSSVHVECKGTLTTTLSCCPLVVMMSITLQLCIMYSKKYKLHCLGCLLRLLFVLIICITFALLIMSLKN